jgi:hypothetical protein
MRMVRRSSVVEQLTVNQLVVGSNPTAGAKTFKSMKPVSFGFQGQLLKP